MLGFAARLGRIWSLVDTCGYSADFCSSVFGREASWSGKVLEATALDNFSWWNEINEGSALEDKFFGDGVIDFEMVVVGSTAFFRRES